MEIGVLNSLTNEGDCFDKVRDFGIKVCQLVSWDHTQATPEMARNVVKHAKAADVQICAVWAGLPPPQVWDFKQGPLTLGIVPKVYRDERIAILKQWADFAKQIGAPAIITHCGFIPENMTDPAYDEVVHAIRDIATYCQQLGIAFWLETGQETPVVLLRTIERVGLDNVGINLDPANLIMYGKGNPIDSLDVIGRFVRNIHVKDGLYPTGGDDLGYEVQVGQGKVNFPLFLERLQEIGYSNPLIIEREIYGENHDHDIRETVSNLKIWLQRGVRA